jgi:hypothetical protein
MVAAGLQGLDISAMAAIITSFMSDPKSRSQQFHSSTL